MHHRAESQRPFLAAYANRHFFCGLVGVLFLLFFTAPHAWSQAAARNSLRIGLLTGARPSSLSTSVERGVQLGAAEAKQTAALFGNDVRLFVLPAGPDVMATASRLLSQRKVQILIGSSADQADALSRFAEREHIIFLNVASRSPSLRAACRRNTFHVEASDGMYSAAASLGGLSVSPAGRDALPATRIDSTVLWSATLERYGASQINDRFRGRYGVGMDGSAWGGWAAVKIVSESFLRAGSGEAPKLVAYLESPETTFDGHKGWPLGFRAADHQLRQPLYVAIRNPANGNREIVRDVPELRGGASAAPPGSSQLNSMLDRIIPSQSGGCRWPH